MKLLGVAALLVLAISAPSVGQIPQRFENLKVLPASISRDSLVQVMRGIATSLGMRCHNCHVGGDSVTLQGVNWASDSLVTKRKARAMLEMTQLINTQFIANLEGRKAPSLRVECVTCHRTTRIPMTLAHLLGELIETEGVAAARQRYRNLRETDMVRGRYDFGEATLNELGSRLARANKTDEAIAMLELNHEFWPRSVQVLQTLGDLHRRKGNNAKALEYYEKGLAIQPNHRQLQQLIAQLKG